MTLHLIFYQLSVCFCPESVPRDKAIVYLWPDGSKIITRLTFSEGTIPNLYTIKLK